LCRRGGAGDQDDRGEGGSGGCVALHLRQILRAHATPCSLRGSSKKTPNFIVAGLVEVFIIESDGDKRFGRKGANDPIGDLAERHARLVGGNRHRDDDLRRIVPAQRGRCRAYRCPGGQPVVDEDHDLAGDVGLRTPIPISLLSAVYLFCLATNDVLNRLVVEVHRTDQIFVYDARSVTGKRPHRELSMSRNPQLADDIHVEREVEAFCNLVPDRNSAARERQHEGIGPIGVDRERLGELRARIGAVFKAYSGTPPSSFSIICWTVGAFPVQVALGGSGCSGTNFVGLCEKSNISPIEVEVSSVV
jgi:hypothetical protein